jgi:hypothetical protein
MSDATVGATRSYAKASGAKQKPREWWICASRAFGSLQEAYKHQEFRARTGLTMLPAVIHVREVLDE